MVNLASLLKHRGCQLTEPVQLRRPLQSARRLASSPWFAAGWGLAAVAWFVHIAALSMAPISLVQAVLAGGAVTLAVMAQRIFGDPVEWRQWLALLLGGAGLALLLLTVALVSGHHRSERLAGHGHVILAAIAGILFALAGIGIKGLTGAGGSSI